MDLDKILPSIGTDENYRRIREALRVEKDKRWGEIAEIEADLGVSTGYLAKVCRGEWRISVDHLLLTLERMGVDPGRFLASALGTRLDNDSLLEEIERFGDVDPRLARIEKATAEVVDSTPSRTALSEVDAEAMVSGFVTCTGKEQRARLGRAKKYCHPDFAAAYLEHLDALRYNDAKEARQNAEAVATKLIPRLTGSRSRRLALQLKAIGVYASCHRQKGNFATAAGALRLALAISRSNRLERSTVELLQRAAWVLSDHGKYSELMALLDEALVICFDLESQTGLGSVMVDRGSALYNLGRYSEAIDTISKALKLLHDTSNRTQRSRLAAHQLLARSYHALGDLEQAESALATAITESEQTGALYQASLLWDSGVISLARGSYDQAEEHLRQAATLFGQLNDRHKAMVTLDLTKTLLAQGKHLEAVAMATSMAEYLTAFQGNKIAEAGISDLIQIALRGNLTQDAINSTQNELEAAGDRSRSR